jgi:FkbM family methyltransferase
VRLVLVRGLRAAVPPFIRRYVHARNVARHRSRYVPRTHVGNYGGRELRVRFEDALAEGWYSEDIPALPEIELLRTVGALKLGSKVFDIGAHQGVVALMYADVVGPSGSVVAVEAERHNARVAERNRDLNGAAQLVVEHAAISQEDGKIRFAESLNGAVHEHARIGTVLVDAVTVDSLSARYGVPDVVVLDVEGFEARALRGATETLERCPAFVVEVHVGQIVDETPTELVATFEGWRRWVAVECPGWGHRFVEFDGSIPDRRFFLIALRPTNSVRLPPS